MGNVVSKYSTKAGNLKESHYLSFLTLPPHSIFTLISAQYLQLLEKANYEQTNASH
jgi:hypothetical protein